MKRSLWLTRAWTPATRVKARPMREAAIALAILVGAGPALAELFVYPTKGQSAEKQEQDKFECYSWAKRQTGFDPMQAPSMASASPPGYGTGPGRGAARGAATGAVVGAIAGDAGKGAAAGAAGGAMIGGMRRRDQARRYESARRQEETNYQAQRAQYDRAWAACLEGRGYTVR